MGLRVPPELDARISRGPPAFFKATTSRDDPAASSASAQLSLALSSDAGQALIEAYVAQVLQNRMAPGKLPTHLAIGLDGDSRRRPWAAQARSAFNAAQLQCSWKTLAPTEGKLRWEDVDAQLAWASKQKLAIQAGPLIDLRAGALPDWIWLWAGDFDAILGMAVDVVRQAVARYKGKVPLWHLVHRPGSTDILGMSEEDQVRLTARLLQVARQADPAAQFVVGLDRPWAEWMASSPFQLGPLHLADYLARAELGMAGIALEIAPGFSAPGSHDPRPPGLLQAPRPVRPAEPPAPPHPRHARAASAPTPRPTPTSRSSVDQWPQPADRRATRPPGVALDRPGRGQAVRPLGHLAAARRLAPHLYPHAGLIRPNRHAQAAPRLAQVVPWRDPQLTASPWAWPAFPGACRARACAVA